MVVAMIVGAVLLPHLDIGVNPPSRQGKTFTVGYKWRGASAEAVEQQVTSVLEGMVSKVKGVETVSSESHMGYGRIWIALKKQANVTTTRFEIATMLRQVYHSLPNGVSYPSLAGGEVDTDDTDKNKNIELLTYTLSGDINEGDLIATAKHVFDSRLKTIDGVKKVELSGNVEQEMEMSYDPQLIATLGISISNIIDALKNFTGKDNIVGDVVTTTISGKQRQTLILNTAGMPLSEIPISTKTGETLYLSSIVTIKKKTKEPDIFFRINGRNTIYLKIISSGDVNKISLSDKLQDVVNEIGKDLPQELEISLANDEAQDERIEVGNLVSRSLASLAILLIFVWLTRRNWKYLSIISVTLMANILMAVVFYRLFDLRLHVFTMAGITVSMTLIIDSSIVMADHYSYFHNRKTFMAILAAVLTTIGSLATVFFLPEEWQANLYDFSRVLTINLGVSLLVALLFVPAITDVLGYDSRNNSNIRQRRRIVWWNKFYSTYIVFARRYRLPIIVLLVLAFGLPIFVLPDKLADENEDSDATWYTKLYDTTLGSDFFRGEVKESLAGITGGSLRLFVNSLDHDSRDNDNEKKHLSIRGQLPIGGAATELNVKVVELENVLRHMAGIKCFTTSIRGRNAWIEVDFDDNVATSYIPYKVENAEIDKMISIGGADWSTYGVRPMGFSNSLNLQYRANRIRLTGYNYNRLREYGEQLIDTMARNPRVRDLMLEVPSKEDSGDEFHIVYDKDRMATYGITENQVYQSLLSWLGKNVVGEYTNDDDTYDVVVKSNKANTFDRWMATNSHIVVGGRNVKLSDIATVLNRKSTTCIPKDGQEYIVNIAFNVLGSYTYAKDYITATIDNFNQALPLGYKCTDDRLGYSQANSNAPYWIIAIVVVVIFFICAILFESLVDSLSIIMVIPFSFIGLFLVFGLTDINFGTGGFASMLMTASLVVNSAIYIVNDYMQIKKRMDGRGNVALYVKAYNHKIIPIFLTTLSTILGLLPFFFDATDDAFWLSFAAGVTGGLSFSIVAVVFFLPMFVKLSSCGRNK